MEIDTADSSNIWRHIFESSAALPTFVYSRFMINIFHRTTTGNIPEKNIFHAHNRKPATRRFLIYLKGAEKIKRKTTQNWKKKRANKGKRQMRANEGLDSPTPP